MSQTSGLSRARQALFLVLVGLLPLHTVFVSAWISWKPYLVAVAVLAVWDLLDGVRLRRWPWHPTLSIVIAVFLAVALIGWPAGEYLSRFVRLYLALVVGGLVLLVTERSLTSGSMLDRTLRVIFWTGAAMGVTAVLITIVSTTSPVLLDAINGLPGVFRVTKPAYLDEGFVALTNWHQDPGYAAAWANLWLGLSVVAVARGVGSKRLWVDGAVLGGLMFAVLMAFSRTGWLTMLIGIPAAVAILGHHQWAERGFLFRRVGAGVLVTAVLVSGMWVIDRPGVGGDVGTEFSFRLTQGWNVLASITGLFERSERFADAFDVSEERADVWPDYVRMFRQHPITGVGLSVGWQTEQIGQEPHNLLLELLAETGLVGTAAFVLILVMVFRRGRGAAGYVALLMALLPSMTQTVLFEPTWWLAAGILVAGGDMRDDRHPVRN
ncbi:MAG: O-antigen ligase family protein [Acidimicrobiia bacterium]